MLGSGCPLLLWPHHGVALWMDSRRVPKRTFGRWYRPLGAACWGFGLQYEYLADLVVRFITRCPPSLNVGRTTYD